MRKLYLLRVRSCFGRSTIRNSKHMRLLVSCRMLIFEQFALMANCVFAPILLKERFRKVSISYLPA